MVGAGRLDQRIEPAADPEQAADPASAPFGVAQDHQGRRRRRGGTAGPAARPGRAPRARRRRSPSGVEQGGAIVVGRERGPLGEADRPAEVGDGQRQVAAEPPAEPRGGRPAEGLAGRPAQRGVEGVGQPPSSRGRLLDQQASRARGPRSAAPGPRTAASRTAAASGSRPCDSHEPGAEGRGAVGRARRAASSRNRARSRASSAESDWRSLDQRGRLGSPPVALRVDDQPLEPAELQRPAVEHEAVAGLEPLGVGPFERADRDPVGQHADRLLRGDRPDVAPEPADHAAAADAEPARPASRSGARSSAAPRPARARRRPAGAARSPARKSRQASKSARVRSAIGAALRIRAKASSARPLAAAGHADQLLAEDVERRVDRPQRLDPALRGPPRP